MAELSLTNLVKSLIDSQSATIQMQAISGQLIHLNCVYKESVAPNFFLVFPPGVIPDKIDVNQPCLLSLEDETGAPIAITARILEVASDRSIEFTALKTINPISLREYFRVDLRTSITISFETPDSGSSRNWSLSGQTLDISGSGVLGLFAEEPKNVHNLFIDINLIQPKKRIQCVGHVVRTVRLRGGRWQVALHFDNITSRDRDAVITNCLWEQRRQLREKVQTAG